MFGLPIFGGLTQVGKCPSQTSPNDLGYSVHEILESDVHSPPKRTFTNPCYSTRKIYGDNHQDMACSWLAEPAYVQQ
jgi:hypothetical protein